MMKKSILLLVAILLGIANGAGAQSIAQKMQMEIMAFSDEDLNIPPPFEIDEKEASGKSQYLALGLSLLLPGTGQYYTERRDKMVIFAAAEALVWSGFFGCRVYANWKEEDYISFAAQRAGADVNDKSDFFFEKLTYYDNLDEYNQLERVYEGDEARIFPSTPEYYWNWDSDQSRAHYRDLRNQSKNAYRRSLLFLGVGIINRIVSGLDAYRSARSYRPHDEFGQSGWKIYCSNIGQEGDDRFETGLLLRF